MDIFYDLFIEKIHSEFVKKEILVIGDLMVDEYVVGKVNRISPEAPVPVLNYYNKTFEAGGASNVANNVHSLGGKVHVAGVAAEDYYGKWLRQYFQNLGIGTEEIIAEEGRATIVKTRFATKGQQLLRVDNEATNPIMESSENKILEYIQQKRDSLDAVILSDYKKGVLSTSAFVKRIIRICNDNHIFVAIDSKSQNIEAFRGADFVKPNNLELEEAVGMQIHDDASLQEAGERYMKRSGTNALIVTRGVKGISMFRTKGKRMDFPAEEVQVFDVTGAGDTVISTITLGMISGMTIEQAIILANLAAGVVISSIGTVPIRQEALCKCIYKKMKK